MKFYLILFIVTFLIQFIPADNKKKYLRRTIVSFVPLFLYGVLRYDCNDFDAYEYFYDSVHGSAFFDEIDEHFEWGWAFFNYIAPSFRFIIVVQTLITFASYAFIFYKTVPPKYSWLAFLLLFLSGDKSIYFLSAMRNTIAIALLITSIPLMEKRDWKKFIVVVFVASLFHTTSLVMLPLAYLAGRPVQMKRKEAAIWLSLLVFLLVVPLDEIVTQIMPFIETDTFERYSTYFDEVHSAGFLVKSVSVLMTIFMLQFMQNGEHSSSENVICRLSLLFIYFGFMGTLNARGSQYYIIPMVLGCTLLYANCKNTIVKYGFTGLTVAYLVYGLFIVEVMNIMSSFITFKSLLDFTR